MNNENLELSRKTVNWRTLWIKSKRRQGCHSCMLSKVNNFKIFRIFNEKFIFLFCELYKRVHNTFMVKLGSFTVYFKGSVATFLLVCFQVSIRALVKPGKMFFISLEKLFSFLRKSTFKILHFWIFWRHLMPISIKQEIHFTE